MKKQTKKLKKPTIAKQLKEANWPKWLEDRFRANYKSGYQSHLQISNCFIWDKTVEGHSFWKKVFSGKTLPVEPRELLRSSNNIDPNYTGMTSNITVFEEKNTDQKAFNDYFEKSREEESKKYSLVKPKSRLTKIKQFFIKWFTPFQLKELTEDTPWVKAWATHRALSADGFLIEYNHYPRHYPSSNRYPDIYWGVHNCATVGEGYNSENYMNSVQIRRSKDAY